MIKSPRYRANSVPDAASKAASNAKGNFPDDLEYETVEASTLEKARDEAVKLNWIGEECYDLRRVDWEPGRMQFVPSEYYDCFTLQSVYQGE